MAWLLCGAAMCGVAGAVGASEIAPVTLSPSAKGVDLVGRLGVYVEQPGEPVPDPSKGEFPTAFEVPAKAPQQSANDLRARWFKFRLRHTGPVRDWVIDSTPTGLLSFQAHGPFDAQGRMLAPPIERKVTQVSPEPMLEGDRFLFRFRLETEGEYVIYLRTVSVFPLMFRFTAWDAVMFGQVEQVRSLFHGLCYGVLLGMLVYSLILLFVFREDLYAYNFLSTLFATLSLMFLNGHAGRYLLEEARVWIPEAMVVMPVLWILFAALFGRSFLSMKIHTPWLEKLTWPLVAVCVLAVVFAVIGKPAWAMYLAHGSALGGPVLMMMAAVRALRAGFRPAAWYIGGLGALFLASISVALVNLEVLQLPFRYQALQVGVVIEVMVIMIALGSRIRSLHEANGLLGRQASVLTKEAHTDPLTGVYNRAGWSRYAAEQLARAPECTMFLIDLDHFKPVNDSYGHDAGDAVLQVVAARMQHLAADGIVARLGGDEFIVLLPYASDTRMAIQMARRLIAELSAPVQYQTHSLRVGASLGIAQGPGDGDNLPALMKAADTAMYATKIRGRNSYTFAADCI